MLLLPSPIGTIPEVAEEVPMADQQAAENVTPTEVTAESTNTPGDAPTHFVQRNQKVVGEQSEQPSKSKKRKGKEPVPPVSQSSGASRSKRIKSQSTNLLISDAYSPTYYTKAMKTFGVRDLSARDFSPEEVFLHPSHKELGFKDYLDSKHLTFWATKLKKFSPSLVREFYANLHPDVMTPGSHWFGKLFVRGKFIELTPSVINTVLELPENDDDSDPFNYFVESTQQVAMGITAEKCTAFGRGKLSPNALTLKYTCPFRFYASNVLPTRNASQLSSHMGKLLFCIDKYLEILNFGWLVVKRMTGYTADHIDKAGRLPYPALITTLLAKQGILPRPDESLELIRPHQPAPNIGTMHNDFKKVLPLAGPRLVVHLRGLLQSQIDKLTTLSDIALALKRTNQQILAQLPRSFTPEAAADDELTATDDDQSLWRFSQKGGAWFRFLIGIIDSWIQGELLWDYNNIITTLLLHDWV